MKNIILFLSLLINIFVISHYFKAKAEFLEYEARILKMNMEILKKCL